MLFHWKSSMREGKRITGPLGSLSVPERWSVNATGNRNGNPTTRVGAKVKN
jgi:hypothetical protein